MFGTWLHACSSCLSLLLACSDTLKEATINYYSKTTTPEAPKNSSIKSPEGQNWPLSLRSQTRTLRSLEIEMTPCSPGTSTAPFTWSNAGFILPSFRASPHQCSLPACAPAQASAPRPLLPPSQNCHHRLLQRRKLFDINSRKKNLLLACTQFD